MALNPVISIWHKPRETVRYVLEHRPIATNLKLMLVMTFLNILQLVATLLTCNQMSLFTLESLAILGGAFAGFYVVFSLALFLGSCVTNVMCRLYGAKGGIKANVYSPRACSGLQPAPMTLLFIFLVLTNDSTVATFPLTPSKIVFLLGVLSTSVLVAHYRY